MSRSQATPGQSAAAGTGTNYSDRDPYYDACSANYGGTGNQTIAMGGKNIGDLLNADHLTWGWFQGGFAPTSRAANGTPVCGRTHTNIGGATVTDYVPHREPFQYYPQTANPLHLPPTSTAMIGHQDRANHQYDLGDFWAAVHTGNMPVVSYLKAGDYQSGHAGSSDPLDEQRFVARTINRLQSLRSWKSTAVIITYDDSDGWSDHQMGPIVNQSQTALDALSATGQCCASTTAVPTTSAGQPEQARCGYGPRLPFMVISPFSKANYVSSSVIDQSSVVRFVEDNSRLGTIGNGSADSEAGSILPMLNFDQHPNRPLDLNPATGEPLH